jgi:arylformamidase
MAHWPGDPSVKVKRRLDMDHGDDVNLSTISMGAHTGTHMDAPVHFIRSGKAIDRMPLASVIGPARVIEIRDPESIEVEELRSHRVRRGERILFKTVNSERCWRTDSFFRDYVHISLEAARLLAARRVRSVGVDYLSVGGFKKDSHETHIVLLKAGVWLIEGLDLSQVRAGRYDLLALPLKIEGGDGAPARVLVRKIKPRLRELTRHSPRPFPRA